MKTQIFLFTLTFLCLSCTKESFEPPLPPSPTKGDIKIRIDYGFSAGNITSKAGPLYMDFYNKYILSKVLTPKTYQLIFTSKDSSSFVTTAIGHWGKTNLIALPKGNYTVTGESNPTANTIAGDTCYLKFNEQVSITAETTSITLKAIYTCSLILVDTTNVAKAELHKAVTQNTNTFKSTLMKTDGYYHTFARDYYLMDRSKYAVMFSLQITKRNSDVVNLLLWNYFWEAGKYYYFANTESGYSLPAMGN